MVPASIPGGRVFFMYHSFWRGHLGAKSRNALARERLLITQLRNVFHRTLVMQGPLIAIAPLAQWLERWSYEP